MSTASDLAAYQAARTSILEGGQSYEILGEKLTRANLVDIEATIARLEKKVFAETATSRRRTLGNPLARR